MRAGQKITQKITGVLRRVPIWPVYAIGALPPVWLFYLGLTGGLGVEPIEALTHELGLLGLQAMVAVLAVTPLRDFTGINLIRFRRALGLLCFYYIFCHLLVWLLLDVRIVSQIWEDILERPYITIGMAAFVLMVPLALTSNNLAVRKLGPVAWRRLHRLTYGAAILGAVHFVMLSRGFQVEPLAYLGVILGLLALRVRFPKAAAA